MERLRGMCSECDSDGVGLAKFIASRHDGGLFAHVCAPCLRKALATLTPDSELEAIVIRTGGQEYRVTVDDLVELARRRARASSGDDAKGGGGAGGAVIAGGVGINALAVGHAGGGSGASRGGTWIGGTPAYVGGGGGRGAFVEGGGGAPISVVVPVGGRGGRGEVRVTQCDSEPAANTSRAGDLTEAQLDRLESEAHAGLSTPGGHGGGYHERRHQLLALVAEVRRHRQ